MVSWRKHIGYKNKKAQKGNAYTYSGEEYLPSYVTTPLSNDGALILEYDDGFPADSEKFYLTRRKLLAGVQRMALEYPKHFLNMVSENGDAETGDVLIQLALFGEIRYS